MEGLLWIQYSENIPSEVVDRILLKVAPFFKDQGIELVMIPKGFEALSREDVKAFLAGMQEFLSVEKVEEI